MVKEKIKKKKRKVQKNRGGNPKPSQAAHDAASESLLGNNFWEIRSKHGRDKLFSSPNLMWEAACEYFQWCNDHPFYRAENKIVSNGGNSGSSVELHKEPVKRPYTMEGLTLFLGCALSYFRSFKATTTDKDFLTVIEQIQQTVYDQQFGGATSGFFNANIISRALGLIDKQDVTSGGEKIVAPEFKVFTSAPPMASDEKEIEKKIKK